MRHWLRRLADPDANVVKKGGKQPPNPPPPPTRQDARIDDGYTREGPVSGARLPKDAYEVAGHPSAITIVTRPAQ